MPEVKVRRRTTDSTYISGKWQTYFFEVNGKMTQGIEKSDGVFKFFSKHCTSLEEAKQHIIDELAKGKNILSI